MPQLTPGDAPLLLRFALGESARGSASRRRLRQAVRQDATHTEKQSTHRRSHFIDERLLPYTADLCRCGLALHLLTLRMVVRRCEVCVAARRCGSGDAEGAAGRVRSRELKPARLPCCSSQAMHTVSCHETWAAWRRRVPPSRLEQQARERVAVQSGLSRVQRVRAG